MIKRYFLAAAVILSALPIACDQTSPMTSGNNPSGPAPTPTVIAASSVTISAGSMTSGGYYSTTTYFYTLSGSASRLGQMTINSGTTVVWDTVAASTTHPLNLDNGSTCLTGSAQTSGYSYVFSTKGTFYCHCSHHGSCTTSCPGGTSCSGMVVQINVI